MKALSLLLFTAVCSAPALAQPNSAVPANIRAATMLDNLAESGGVDSFEHLYGIPLNREQS